MELLKGRILQQNGINFFMEACPVLLRCWDGTARKVFLHKGFPLGELFIAPIQPEVDRKTHRTTDIMTRDRIVRERVCVIAVVVMAGDLGGKNAPPVSPRVIRNKQER